MCRLTTKVVRYAFQRSYSTQTSFRLTPELSKLDLPYFREAYFLPGTPVVLRGSFNSLPAKEKWFSTAEFPVATTILNSHYLEPHKDTWVPLEITSKVEVDREEQQFMRMDATLGQFLDACKQENIGSSRIYLAQCPLSDLPRPLQEDLPTPELVKGAGKGDLYNSSIWLGIAPTYTPLHKDPNPNLFVQLAGSKVVRLLDPHCGLNAYKSVRARMGGGGHPGMRGDEMMMGLEARELDKEVWGEDGCGNSATPIDQGTFGFEARLDPGDGLFIPKGWWHSLKGVGTGMTGSVNWWFR